MLPALQPMIELIGTPSDAGTGVPVARLGPQALRKAGHALDLLQSLLARPHGGGADGSVDLGRT